MPAKPSRYNVLVNDGDGGIIIFNTLYGSTTKASRDEAQRVQNLFSGGTATGEDSLTDILLRQRHLVDDGVDELSIVEARKRAGIADRNRLDVIVMPTLDCNLRCKYCYEDRRPGRMTPPVRQRLQRWLSAEIPVHKVLLLSWFGGEPSLALDTVLEVSRHAIAVARENCVEPIVHMTTNGYALSKDAIRALVNTGVHSYQVTVDGIRRSHNELRPTTSGHGTYDRILANVHELARASDHVTITLRVNFNRENIGHLDSVLSDIDAPLRKQIRVAFEPIFGDVSCSAYAHLDGGEMADAMAAACSAAERMGFSGTSMTPSTGKLVYCYAERESQVIIDPDGNVFKCSVQQFRADDRVGYISEDGALVKTDAWTRWTSADPLFAAGCLECPYLPMCMGGCRSIRRSRQADDPCALVATNASHVLKMIAFDKFRTLSFGPPGEEKPRWTSS